MVDFNTSKVDGNTVTAIEWNQLADIDNLVTTSGQTTSTSNLNQLGIGVARYSSGGQFFTDSGTANAYVLTPVSPFKAPVSSTEGYFEGMTIRFRAGNANTGASTVNVNSAGVKNLKKEDGTTDLASGDIITDRDVEFRYNGTSFVLVQNKLNADLINQNFIINGDFSVAQRGTSFTAATTPYNNNDASYTLDRWLLLSDGNDIVDVSQELTEKPNGAYASIKFEQENGNKQWGILQILEAIDAAALIGGVTSLSFEAKKGSLNATVEKLRAAIISWDGTIDQPTVDCIATWAGAGTNPTLAANWNYENTPSDLTLTTSFQQFKIENIAIDTASAKNIGVFIWIDDTDATINDLVYISKIKIQKGDSATNNIPRPFAEELSLCQRFFQTPLKAGVGAFPGFTNASTQGTGCLNFITEMRVPPTMSNSAASGFKFNNATNNYMASAVSFLQISTFRANIQLTISAATANTGGVVDNTASGYIHANSEF